jgi:D-alanine--poly(phosphoribitol) ligase subunit 2
VAVLLNESLAIQVGSPDTDLIETGALDSMALVQLAHAIEERFGLRLPPMSELDVDAFRSVATMTDLILDHRLESVESVEEPAVSSGREARPGPAVNGKPAPAPDAARLAVAGEIQSLLLTEFSVRVDSPDEDLFRGGALDSMTLVQFILALENHFGIQIPLDDLDLEKVTSVTRAADLVSSRRLANKASVSETLAAFR